MDDKTTAIQLAKFVNAKGYSVSKTMIIRTRRILGWTFHVSRYCQMIRGENKEKQRARKNLNNKFDDIVWTDESKIQLENHWTISYHKEGESPRPKARPKHPYKVMVWAGTSREGATNICLRNCWMNSAVYQEVLCSNLVPFLRTKLPNGRLQQDNASCHVSKATYRFLKKTTSPSSRPHMNVLTATPLKVCGTNRNTLFVPQWSPAAKKSLFRG